MIAFIQINRVLASSLREPRRNLSAATKTWRSHRQDAFRLQEQHSFPICFSLRPKGPIVQSGTRSIGTETPDPYKESETEFEWGVRIRRRRTTLLA
ncbi:hypothetical protein AVEN_30474-1 [Araneus ventricosus]|uniref:Uncharacterized protein n=1 Tax=Araneus ventricosus TaxID=182803 RepID=A0A4Y2SUQ3_ARAVE|nr:hypothetical protein AVEN_30474-1 [Araneus ventricosus]